MIAGAGRAALRLGLGGLALAALAVAVTLAIGRRDPRVLPVDPGVVFDPALRRTAADYAAIRYGLWATGSILRWGTLAAMVALGTGGVLAAAGRRIVGRSAFASAFLTAALLLATLSLVALPTAYMGGHEVERAYGLSTQDVAGWLADWSKRRAFWIPLYSVLLAGFLWSIGRWRRRGWMVAAAGGTAVAALGVYLAPRLIDPLFHDFRPLEDRSLANEIVTLGRRAGLDVERVVVMDASRRTRRLNAYVTGFGATQQVVLYDNLVERAPRDELLLVVAHEIGHAAKNHVLQGLLWAIPAIVVGIGGLTALARWQASPGNPLGARAGVTNPADPAGLPLLWLAVSLALFLTSPVQSALSRKVEAEADWISLELTRDPDTFVAVSKRLARTNLSPVTPPGWLVDWLWTHPPVLDRIGMAEYWRRAHAEAGEAGDSDHLTSP